MTQALFPSSSQPAESYPLAAPDSDLRYFPQLFAPAEADSLLASLLRDINWQHTNIKLYGKVHPLPRLTAWYGDANRSYSYSGITLMTEPWCPLLLTIKNRIEAAAALSTPETTPATAAMPNRKATAAAFRTPETTSANAASPNRSGKIATPRFNSVLLNLYRDEQDSVAWHSDDEPELGPNPTIGSVSFGAARTFQLRHKRTKQRLALSLEHGSYLLMQGPTQHHWEHQLPKSARAMGPRVNLTFRTTRQHRQERS